MYIHQQEVSYFIENVRENVKNQIMSCQKRGNISDVIWTPQFGVHNLIF